MKTIVIDARELRTSTGRYVERLLDHLQEVDNDLSHRYIVLLKPKDMDGWEPKSKRFSKLACRFKEFTVGEQLGLAWQLYKLKPDLVHFCMAQQPILYFGKSVTTMHDLTTLRFQNPAKNKLIFKFKQRVYYWVNYIAAHKSKAIIVPSEYVKDDVARAMSANSRKITVTYEGSDQVSAEPEPMPELEDRPFIMYVGRSTPHKNLRRLIQAFAQLKEKHPELKLVLVGKEDFNYRRHAWFVKRHDISDVIFTGYASDGQLRWLYEHCQAYVFPSLSEGFGLPALEAMASGAPVASSNATCLPEIYGDAVRYFDPEDIDAMAKAINDILTKPELRESLIIAGKKQAAKYSWKRMAEQTYEIYRQALHEHIPQ